MTRTAIAGSAARGRARAAAAGSRCPTGTGSTARTRAATSSRRTAASSGTTICRWWCVRVPTARRNDESDQSRREPRVHEGESTRSTSQRHHHRPSRSRKRHRMPLSHAIPALPDCRTRAVNRIEGAALKFGEPARMRLMRLAACLSVFEFPCAFEENAKKEASPGRATVHADDPRDRETEAKRKPDRS